MLGIDKDKMRVLVGDVGGGFGMKTTLYREDVVAAWSRGSTKRPVKWTADRMEEFLSATHGRDLAKPRDARDSTSTARSSRCRVHSHANLGAYCTPAGAIIQLLIGPWVSTSVYDIHDDRHADRGRAHQHHADRARTAARAGRRRSTRSSGCSTPLARKSGIDRVELRRRNMIRPAQMPYKNAMGKTYDIGQFERVLDLGPRARRTGKDSTRAPAASQAKGKLRGRGIATFLEWTGAEVFEEQVTVTVRGRRDRDLLRDAADGHVAHHHVHAARGRRVRRAAGKDPLRVRRHRPRHRIRQRGLALAVRRRLRRARRVRAHREEGARARRARSSKRRRGDIEYRDGVFRIAGTDRSIGLFDLADKQADKRIVLVSQSKVAEATWPNGCHVCEVEIDPDTGEVERRRTTGR